MRTNPTKNKHNKQEVNQANSESYPDMSPEQISFPKKQGLFLP
jgi:hypothetical protein